MKGKTFRGQTQEGKRIRETSVKTSDLGIDEDRTLEQITTELERLAAPLDFAGDYKVVYYAGVDKTQVSKDIRLLNSAVKIAEYPKGTVDGGIPKDKFNKPIIPEGASVPNNKTYRRIEYDNFDIPAYREHIKAGGNKVKSLRAKLIATEEQLNVFHNLGDMKASDVQKYVDLNEEIMNLRIDPGAIEPNPRWYARRSQANVDNTDVTLVVFNKNKLINSGRSGKKLVH